MKDVLGNGAEPDPMPVYHAFNRALLVRPVKVPGNSIAILHELNVLDDDLSVFGVSGVNDPTAFDVVRWLLRQCSVAKHQRQKNQAGQFRPCDELLHDFLR